MTNSLLSRLQALTGPDREIDAEIALANGWRRAPFPRVGESWYSPKGMIQPAPPRYTENLDAAKSLLSDDDAWQVGTHPSGGFQAYVWDIEGRSNASAAIALCIAWQKAKEESKP